MTEIIGSASRDILLGKEVGNFGSKAEASKAAKEHKGSELIALNGDGKWHVSDLQEDGKIYGANDISKSEKDNLKFSDEKMTSFGIKVSVVSFVDNEEKVILPTNNYEKQIMAYDENTPVEILKILAHDNDEFIRFAVAVNKSTDIETLKELAIGNSLWVISGVADNPNTPPETLKELSKENHIKENVAGNPNTPHDVLRELGYNKYGYVRRNVAKNPSTPRETLILLSKDKDLLVRKNVASNPGTSKETLKFLTESTDISIRHLALKNLNSQK